MAAQFKAGDFVRIVKPLDGTVDAVKFNEETGEPRIYVKWIEEGEERHRWFNEAELTALPA